VINHKKGKYDLLASMIADYSKNVIAFFGEMHAPQLLAIKITPVNGLADCPHPHFFIHFCASNHVDSFHESNFDDVFLPNGKAKIKKLTSLKCITTVWLPRLISQRGLPRGLPITATSNMVLNITHIHFHHCLTSLLGKKGQTFK
jgi:hypothetical protein